MSPSALSRASELRAEMVRLQQRIQELRLKLERIDGVQNLSETIDVVTGLVGEQTVALPLSLVEEVVLVPALLPIPDSPPWQPGMLLLRGESIPVVDVLARFEGKSRDVGPSEVVVITHLADEHVGLLLQDVSGVWSVAKGDLQPATDGALLASYILGFVPVQDRLGMLLSVQALASSVEVR